MNLASRLNRPDWPARLELLGVEEVDRQPIIDMVQTVLADPQQLDRAGQMAQELLVDQIGNWRDVWQRPGFQEIELLHPVMASALPLCALLATADDVHAHHLQRGIPADISWHSLADVGQQVTKHRLVTGRTGLTQSNWLRNVWSGDYIRLGRLQFELGDWELPEGSRRVLNTHIPAPGRLDAAEVDASLLRAPAFFAEHFGDQLDAPLEWVVCASWLLDHELLDLLPGSNVADFAARWEPFKVEDKDRDGYYFVFNIEPLPGTTLPFKLDELPQNSSLERALVDRWRSGGHVRVTSGRIPAGAVRS